MTDCDLFCGLSRHIGEMILQSRRYYRPTTNGIPEPSLTDVILYYLSVYGRDVTIHVPQESTTGADLDLILVDGSGRIWPFAVQAKKLMFDGAYREINRCNSNGFQTDLLCGRRPFHPLYLFYNWPGGGATDGCAIADGFAVRNLALPSRGLTPDRLPHALLARVQTGWEALVCPAAPGGVVDVRRIFAGLRPDTFADSDPLPRPVALSELPTLHRAAVEGSDAALSEIGFEGPQPPIIVVRLSRD